MPREKSLIKTIPKIYKRNFENLGLFFWVEAQKQIIPKITDEQAIRNYYNFLKESQSCEVARVNLSRMRAEYIDLAYSKHCDETAEANK